MLLGIAQGVSGAPVIGRALVSLGALLRRLEEPRPVPQVLQGRPRSRARHRHGCWSTVTEESSPVVRSPSDVVRTFRTLSSGLATLGQRRLSSLRCGPRRSLRVERCSLTSGTGGPSCRTTRCIGDHAPLGLPAGPHWWPLLLSSTAAVLQLLFTQELRREARGEKVIEKAAARCPPETAG